MAEAEARLDSGVSMVPAGEAAAVSPAVVARGVVDD